MVDYVHGGLFNETSVEKQLKITVAEEGGMASFEICNTDLYSESMELTESLCSESALRFGTCEASMLSFQCKNNFTTLLGRNIGVSIAVGGHDDSPFMLGRYRVASDKPSADRKCRSVTAYDAMYDVMNTEVSSWYNSLEFPLTLKEFRDSFFGQFPGLEQAETELPQDTMTVEKTIDTGSISGKTVIEAICEINGRFGHINRNGQFEYVKLAGLYDYYYPSADLYPSKDFYPGALRQTDEEAEEITASRYISCEYEDFETELINKLQIRQDDDDVGTIIGSGSNCYITTGNFLVSGKGAEEMDEIAQAMYDEIHGVTYRPFKARVMGNPCIEVGDLVCFHTRFQEVKGYVLERTLTGIQSLRDTFTANGEKEYSEKVNSVSESIKNLKGKTNKLTRTVEENRLEVADFEKAVQTTIKQLADSISITMDENGNIKTSLELDKNGMSFKGNKVVFGFDNFKLDEAGNVEISGKFSNKAANGMKAVEISESCVDVYSFMTDGHKSGRFGSAYSGQPGQGQDMVGVSVNKGDLFYIGEQSPGSALVNSYFEIDTSNPAGTPFIKNTASGTIFPNNRNGITVNHGLITGWNLDYASGTLHMVSNLTFSQNAITGIWMTEITFVDGIITGWSERKTWPK